MEALTHFVNTEQALEVRHHAKFWWGSSHTALVSIFHRHSGAEDIYKQRYFRKAFGLNQFCNSGVNQVLVSSWRASSPRSTRLLSEEWTNLIDGANSNCLLKMMVLAMVEWNLGPDILSWKLIIKFYNHVYHLVHLKVISKVVFGLSSKVLRILE